MASNGTPSPVYDEIIQSITEYVFDYEITSPLAWKRARVALLDSMACAIEGIPACASFIGPFMKGAVVPNGFPLPGTSYLLDPLKAVFDLGALIRYLDHSDANLGAEWGHPSDNIGGILPIADFLSRNGDKTMTMDKVLEAIIKAYEIQGCFQIKNGFNKVGIDHVILVKVASTAVLSKLMGLTRAQTNDAISHAFVDGQPLRIYRQAPNASPRKGWAGGDACMRAVHLVFMVKSGQPGFPTALTDPRWGFYDASFRGKAFSLPVPFSSKIIETHFFKLAAGEGHGISAVEAALVVSKQLKGKFHSVRQIKIRTQAAAVIIIDKTGPLRNAADRDHCMRYMVAVTLLKGDYPEAKDYFDESHWANNPSVDELRGKITMEEDPQMTRDYHNPNREKLANGITVIMEDGTILDEVLIEPPMGHPKREDTIPLVRTKFTKLSKTVLKDPARVWDETMKEDLANVQVRDWVDQFAVPA